MFVIDRLKLNRFRAVKCPKNKDLFERVGLRPVKEMADGQVASFTNGTMEAIDAAEAYLIRESQMPLADDDPLKK